MYSRKNKTIAQLTTKPDSIPFIVKGAFRISWRQAPDRTRHEGLGTFMREQSCLSSFTGDRRKVSHRLICGQSDANGRRSLLACLVLHWKFSSFWHVNKLFFLETTSREPVGICPSSTASSRRGAVWDWCSTDLFKGLTEHSGCSLGQALAAGLGQGLAGG